MVSSEMSMSETDDSNQEEQKASLASNDQDKTPIENRTTEVQKSKEAKEAKKNMKLQKLFNKYKDCSICLETF